MSRNPLHALVPVTFLVLAAAPSSWAGLRRCAELVVTDPIADPGNLTPAGAVLDVDLDQPIDQNVSVLGGLGGALFLSHGAVTPGARIFVADLEAGVGPDPGTGLSRGEVFELDDAGNLLVVSDGTTCGASIANCAPSAFQDPTGLEWDGVRGRLIVADIDADPSGFGLDSWDGEGHGAIYSVDLARGTVDLVADGSRYTTGPIPFGRPSIFEDPLSAAMTRDGTTLFVVDQLAVPLGTGGAGAVLRVDVARGDVALVAVSPEFRGLRDVAIEPAGTLLVLDRLAGGRGTVFRVDPALPPQSSVVARFAPRELVEPMGIVVRGDGETFVMDNAADPMATGVSGAVFRIDAALTTATPVSAAREYASPWSVALVASEAISAALPSFGTSGTSLTVTLTGGVFEAGALVDFGPSVVVDAVRLVSPTTLDVDVTIPPATPPQRVDVGVSNPGWQTHAFHCELFEVRGASGTCHPQVEMGPTLRVSKPAVGDVRLTWTGTGDACWASFRVRRAFTARPSVGDGAFPDDPAFTDVTADDDDGTSADADFTHQATPGTVEYYLVTEVGTDGLEGPSGHY